MILLVPNWRAYLAWWLVNSLSFISTSKVTLMMKHLRNGNVMHGGNDNSVSILEEKAMSFGVKTTPRYNWVSRSHPGLLKMTSSRSTSCHKWQERSVKERNRCPRGNFYHFSQAEQLHLLPTVEKWIEKSPALICQLYVILIEFHGISKFDLKIW